MKRIIITATLAASLCFFSNCKDQSSSEGENLTQEISFNKEGELTLMKQNTDSVIAKLDIEIADDEYQTQTGLMYRHSMPKNEAMLFVFENSQPRSFYMKNTEFSLDIIYFNSEKKIVSIQENAKPYDEKSLPSEGASQYVLEVNGGLSNLWKLEKGDRMEFTIDD